MLRPHTFMETDDDGNDDDDDDDDTKSECVDDRYWNIFRHYRVTHLYDTV